MHEHISTDDLVNSLRDYRMSPLEKRAQRVSMIMGLRAERSTLTRELVEDLLDTYEGHDGPPETAAAA